MILLILFAFIAGVVTIASPCILPVLPFILASSDKNGGRKKPLGVVAGFVASFTFFTMFLSTIVRFFGIPADILRTISVCILFVFGLTLIMPRIQVFFEILLSRIAGAAAGVNKNRGGFWGGVVVGLSLGLLWTPCVGPILASVISLAITGTVTLDAFIITVAYASGTAIPMFLIMAAGGKVLTKVPWLVANSANIQKAFGVMMILTSLAIFMNFDRQFQTYILSTFPRYGQGLTSFEDNKVVNDALIKLQQQPALQGPNAPELVPGGQWFNSEPRTMESLKGNVVLIDFWTYTCINCQRTLPYLRNWWEKYKDQGLVIIGVHSPEFEFEKNPENVAQALTDFGLTYPVVQDNDFATWRAYGNRYWPAKYLIDRDGVIRYTHFGEGAYDETEEMIQTLLDVQNTNISNPEYELFGRTPELYLGYERIAHLASPETINRNGITVFSIPQTLGNGEFAYGGQWMISGEYANPKAGARLVLNFEAKNVFLVARPLISGASFSVSLDNEDVRVVDVDSDRLYTLVDIPLPGVHTLELMFPTDSVEIYAFTFG